MSNERHNSKIKIDHATIDGQEVTDVEVPIPDGVNMLIVGIKEGDYFGYYRRKGIIDSRYTLDIVPERLPVNCAMLTRCLL